MSENLEVDLAELRATRAGLGLAIRSKLTRKAYNCDWKGFERWCGNFGRAALPASEDTVELYLTWLLKHRNRKAATGTRHAAAISARHKDSGHPNPVTLKVRDVMTSVRREREERPKRKRALSPDDLAAAARLCDPNTNRGTRDRALLIFGFASSLRRSEISRLRLSDVTFVAGKGIVIFVGRSKNDQDCVGRDLSVWPGRQADTDPVRLLQRWIEKRGSFEGPLFCRVSLADTVKRNPLSGDSICEIVKGAIRRTGIDATPYGAHSLRAGAATASAGIGRSDQEIMGMTGHKTARAMQMYVRRQRAFAGRNPLEGVL
jgi:integrase